MIIRQECWGCRQEFEWDNGRGRPRKYCLRCGGTKNEGFRKRLRNICSRYQITRDEFLDLCERAGNRCEACGEEAPLVVDHDHETDLIRGMICDRCNLTLGTARDSVDRLRGLIVYLETRITVSTDETG